jgi:tyrosyl-tRNA synthetase
VELYHSSRAATAAEEDFLARFRYERLPENLPEVHIPNIAGSLAPITELMVAGGVASSKSEARRKIEEGAVSYGDPENLQKIADFRAAVMIGEGQILKIGKRKIVRLIPGSGDGK